MPIPFESSVGSFPISGIGAMTVTASAALSTITLSPGSSGMPTTPTVVTIKVLTGSAVSYLLPNGGQATAANGFPIDPGTSFSFNLKNPSLATLFCASSGAVVAIW